MAEKNDCLHQGGSTFKGLDTVRGVYVYTCDDCKTELTNNGAAPGGGRNEAARVRDAERSRRSWLRLNDPVKKGDSKGKKK